MGQLFRRDIGKHVELDLRLSTRRTSGDVVAGFRQVENDQVPGGAGQGFRATAHDRAGVVLVISYRCDLQPAY